MALFDKPYRAKYGKEGGFNYRGLIYWLAVLVATVFSVVFTTNMIKTVVKGTADSGSSASGNSRNLAIMQRHDMYMTNSISAALDGIVTIEPIYVLYDEDLTAPKPNPSCAGKTDDPTSLGWLLEEAEKKVSATDTLFERDMLSGKEELMAGSKVHYYLDETIMVITWQRKIHGAEYTFSEVKIDHPSQFRRFLADGTFGSAKQYMTTEMAATVNAVTASSGDFYKFRPYGVMVYNGVVYRTNDDLDTCYIDEDGNMIFSRQGELGNKADAEKFVEENNVRFSLAFGPVLVENGKVCEDVARKYPIGEGQNRYSRAGLGQMGELHYLLVTANLKEGKNTPTIPMFAEKMEEFGCITAYSLDGGQTAAIVTNGQLINRPDYGYQRKISDIIYFATALPEED